MKSGRERVCEYDVFFTSLSNFDQYASNFLNLLAVSKFFFIKTHPFQAVI